MICADLSVAPSTAVYELDAALWGTFASEMVKIVMPFLPMPDLCRHRSTCKKWDMLIRSEELGPVHARKGAKRDATEVWLQKLLVLQSTEPGRRAFLE